MSNGRKEAYVLLFIIIWVISLIFVYWLAPSSWIYYISPPLKKIALFFFPTIKRNVDLFTEQHARALLCVVFLAIYSSIMYYPLNKHLDGLMKQISNRNYSCKNNSEWSNYMSTKISIYAVFAGAMGTILVLLIGFLITTRQAGNPGVQLICYMGALLLVIGIILTLFCVEIMDTASGRRWSNSERNLFLDRALRYYTFSWYCLIFSILILVSAVEPFITFVGALLYSLIAPRYFFFTNLPQWKF